MCKIAAWNNRSSVPSFFNPNSSLSFLTPPFRNEGVVPDVQVQIEMKEKGKKQRQVR